jgi:hypothetical protein
VCSNVDVTGFANSVLNTRYIEDKEKLVYDEPTLVGIVNETYIYWCEPLNRYIINAMADFDPAPTECQGQALTTNEIGDFLTAPWQEFVDSNGDGKVQPREIIPLSPANPGSTEATFHCGQGKSLFCHCEFFHTPNAHSFHVIASTSMNHDLIFDPSRICMYLCL